MGLQKYLVPHQSLNFFLLFFLAKVAGNKYAYSITIAKCQHEPEGKKHGSKYFWTIYVECRKYDPNLGTVVIDTNGGSETRYRGADGPQRSLISLCSKCFLATEHVDASKRFKTCLQQSKRRLPAFIWNSLVSKIPHRGKTKLYGGITGGNENNHLLKRLKVISKPTKRISKRGILAKS